MNEIEAIEYPATEPLGKTSTEMATARIKVISAKHGSFRIGGKERTAFVVGSCLAPVEVTYSRNASCTEFILSPWMGTAVLGVSGRELSCSIGDIADLPKPPFLDALRKASPSALEIAGTAYANWSAGRGTADARLAREVWCALQKDPTRRLDGIAGSLGVSDRRVRAAVKRETGQSPAQWRKLIRLEKASRLIAKTFASMAAVAVDAGYADQSHMNRDFIELADTTPSAMRQALRPS